jgi:PAS domain S-box-containing protein
MRVNPQSDLVATANSRCQKLLERIPHLAWLMTDRGKIIAVNQRWCDYTGSCDFIATQGHDRACPNRSDRDLAVASVGTDREPPQQLFTDILQAGERDRFILAWEEAQRWQTPLEIKLQFRGLVEWEWFKLELEPDDDELGLTTWICTAVRLGTDYKRDLSQLKQAQADCHHAQSYSQRLATALQVAKVGAWEWNIDTDNVFWTPEFEALFDYEPGTTAQTYPEWLARIHPDDRQRVEIAIKATLDRQVPEYRCEYRIIVRAGRIRWIDAIGELHINEAGETQMSGLIYDITERKHNEEALRHSEEFTRRVLASTQDCIKVIDLEGYIIYMNDGGQSLMEIDNFSSIVNTKWSELWQGREAQSAHAAIDIARAGGVGRFEGYCQTVKGTPKCWEVVVTQIQDAVGNTVQLLVVSRDITARKQAQIDLQISEELFRHTFEYTSVGFCHVALDGTWLWVNNKLCEIVGYSPAELLATTFQAITEPADLAEDLALVEQLIAGKIGEYTLEKRYIHKQGHQVWVNLTVSLIRERDLDRQLGAPRHFISAIQDITERKQLEFLTQSQTEDLQHLNRSLLLAQQQLKDRNQELDAFVYTVSHDLKAPLRSISNLSEWIEEDLQDRLLETERAQFVLLRQRVQRLNALIHGLLQYSRVGTQELETHIVDVNQLVAETLDSLDPPASLTIDIISPLPTLNAKRILIAQIFANLLSNAIEHHDRDDGRIEVGVEDLGDFYRFSIADDGPGIPPGEDRLRIFDMFRTLKPSVSTKNTGIGLALVKKIVEGEGGRIWVADDIPASQLSGACFYFTWKK